MTMQFLADQLKGRLSAPYLFIRTDDKLGSSVCVYGSFDAKETWSYGIRENSRYFTFLIRPKFSRYYTDGDVLEVILVAASYKLNKFRKYSGSPEKIINKIEQWIKQENVS